VRNLYKSGKGSDTMGEEIPTKPEKEEKDKEKEDKKLKEYYDADVPG